MAKEEKVVGPTKETKRKITVDADALARILEDNEDLKTRLARVEATSDLARLENYDQKRRKPGATRYRVSTLNGKLITGWRTLVNKHWKDGNIMRVQQDYEILLEDNTKVEVKGYENFSTTRYEAQMVGELVKKDTDAETGATTLTLKLVSIGNSEEDPAASPLYDQLKPLIGRTIVIDPTFVN